MTEKKYVIDTPENKAFLKSIRDTLLAFGHQFPSPGGGSYYLGDDGTPWKERPRETWITSRMAHVYSMGSFLKHEGSEALADAALKGLCGELHDDANGGWYAGLTSEGEILPTKQCYAHAFVILAAASGLLAGRPQAKELLDDALAVYDKYFWNEEEGLSCDTWNTEFTELDSYRGLNANMHTVEAFLAVADVIGDEKYRVRAGRIIDQVLVWSKNNDWRIPEHYSSDWVADLDCNKEKPDDPFKPFGATPGHGIEWSRLITQWASSSYKLKKKSEDCCKTRKGDSSKFTTDSCTDGNTEYTPSEKYKGYSANADSYFDAAENLFNRAIADAWNADGAPGICYTTDWEGKPVVHDRMHWTLCEAINTSACLYRLTAKEVYANKFSDFMKYLDEKVLDHVNGSWFHQLNQNNELLTTVWPGKSDLYHATQATLIPYAPIDTSIAVSVKNME